MVVHDDRVIGTWFWYWGYFGADTHFVLEHNNPESRVFLSKVLDIIKVLKKHQLMLEVKGKGDVNLRTNSLNNFIQDYYQDLSNTTLDCVSNTLYGSGIVVCSSQKELVCKRVISIDIDTPPLCLEVIVHSPVFLPITLDGYPQKILYDHNAPRLEKALQEIEECLGSKPDHEESEVSEYAKMKGYSLVNLIEDDGIMDGLNERGHVLDQDKVPKVPFDPEYLKSLI